MTPVRNGTTRNSKNIYSELKDMIQFLDLKPGQAISESQLCVSLGVSRTPVREALIRLADEKLVCFFPQSGTYVTRIDLDYIKELGLMRSLIERSIVLSICGKVKVIDEFQEIMFLQKLAMERKNTRESIQLNDIFHYKLFEKRVIGHMAADYCLPLTTRAIICWLCPLSKDWSISIMSIPPSCEA